MAETFTPSSVVTFTNDTTAVNTVNNNFTAISTAFTDVLSRSGVSPNQMTSNLDMNNNQILNLPPPATINSPARLVDVAGNPNLTVPPTGTSGAVVGFLNGNNTYSGSSTFTGAILVTMGLINSNPYTVLSGDYILIVNTGTALTVTLPSPSIAGRVLIFQNIVNQLVSSSASNVTSLTNVIGTQILPAVSGKWTVLVSDGTFWRTVESNAALPNPVTVQRFTTGSGTYTPTAGTNSIKVRMCGGGGGGAAGTTNSGGAGTASSFNLWTVNPGAGGAPSGGAGGLGGSSGTNGSGVLVVRITGSTGITATNAGVPTPGGDGGSTPFFSGAGNGNTGAAGSNAVVNTGAGGAGGGSSAATGGSGGGSGEYVEFYVFSPTSCSYAVGSGGTGGVAGGFAGGTGASGIIIVEEYPF